MTIEFKAFEAADIIPESHRLVCILEPLDPNFHGDLRTATVLACGSCGIDGEIAPGSRVMIAECAGLRFTLADQPLVLLRRVEVLAVVHELFPPARTRR